MKLYAIAAIALSLIACHEDRPPSDRSGDDVGGYDVGEAGEGDAYVQPEPDEDGMCPDGHLRKRNYAGPYCMVICEDADDWCPDGQFCAVAFRHCTWP